MVKRINQLIEANGRDPFAGIGKPEPLNLKTAVDRSDRFVTDR
ncbi:MAG: type II toxin-antitoxin system YoeB family toxin [Thiobacillaceae bacterium]